jgi:hypothetical protein
MTFPKSFTTNSFIEQPDGQFKATIPASTHGLGINYRVTKMMRRNSNLDWENQVATFKILENGDFEYYVSEPCICKVLLVGDE